MKFRRKPKEKLDITLISMIDVVFVLLLFFVVSTRFNQQTGISIQLPEAAGEQTQAQPKMVTLLISAEGHYLLENEDGTPEELPDQKKETLLQELRKRAEMSSQEPFIIKADDKTAHQYVITALDFAGQAGFTHITFATQEEHDDK
ncbi:Biopolymer transport protein [Crenothrix polyspora]|jgi:biopolymer transport protein ExbD|uniref:Biopolymer transport protein n=1 Tax=Crenothrix polyspora TaxID=360316 RepID=A0A1R4H1U7_9GAMM|nr:biopolymer transporter ExbD [Crenothrix polyspora]SJM90175.1 Biopolymer transport protein [Crenothrix polyspora]